MPKRLNINSVLERRLDDQDLGLHIAQLNTDIAKGEGICNAPPLSY